MYLYHWDPETKEFLGVSPARIDPLESFKKGETVYLQGCPFTTLIGVPYFNKKEIPVWDGEEWVIKKDFRGDIVYNIETGIPATVLSIGEIPEKYTVKKPTKYEKWSNGNWVPDLQKAIKQKIAELSSFRNEKNEIVWEKRSIPIGNWLDFYQKKTWLKKNEGSVSSVPCKIGGDIWVELNLESIEEILALIENQKIEYDLNEFNHVKTISTLESTEEIENYDFKKGW